MKTVQHGRQGFSLVEVALALMVVGVGMVAVFSVLPAGLTANKHAIDDSQTALFSEEVFNGFRSVAAVTNWASLGSAKLPNPVPHMWDGSVVLEIRPSAPGTNVYKSVWGGKVVDYALQYTLTMTDVVGQPDIKGLTLLVWNGAYGRSVKPRVFYTEIRRSRP